MDPVLANTKNKLRVSNLPDQVSKDDLRDLFAKYGPIEIIILNDNTAIVEFGNHRDARSALGALNNRPFDRKIINLEYYEEPELVELEYISSPIERSISPSGRGITPSRRSISPSRRSISPSRRSISPSRRSISPSRRSISPSRRSISQSGRSISPSRRSMSPYRRNALSYIPQISEKQYKTIKSPLTDDSLDAAVENLANVKHYAEVKHLLLPYWYHYKDEMLNIFHSEYRALGLPRWVRYDLFEFDMLLEMANKLFEDIIYENILNGQVGDEIDVDFSFILGIPLHSSDLDIGASGIWDRINNLGITMKVKFLKGG
jgi:hypothetical protein